MNTAVEYSGGGGAMMPIADSNVEIAVVSHSDAEIFLVRYDLSLVANGVGRLRTRQPPGIYSLRVVRAGFMKEELIAAAGERIDRRVIISEVPTVFPSRAILGADADRFIERLGLAGPPRRLRQRGAGGTPSGSLLLMASQDASCSGDPLDGIRVRPWRGDRRMASPKHGGHAPFEAGERRWSAAVVDGRSRRLTVEIDLDGRPVRFSVPVLQGRQAQVFLRRTSWADAEEGLDDMPPRRTPWIDLAVAQVPEDAGHGGRWGALLGDGKCVSPATGESYRLALARGRRIIRSNADMRRALRLGEEDPYIAIAAAHLMLDALEKRRDRRQRGEALGTVARLTIGPAAAAEICWWLDRRFGETFDYDQPCRDADHAAVLLRAGMLGDFFSRHPSLVINEPPLYRRSWDILLKYAAETTKVWIDPRLYDEVKLATFLGAYFAWHPTAMSLQQFIQRARNASGSGQRAFQTSSRATEAASGARGSILANRMLSTLPETILNQSQVKRGAWGWDLLIPLSVQSPVGS